MIRYTLDGTCPCKETALTYEGPITITEDTVLRAAALLDGVYSDTIRLELTVANGTEEPENPDDPGGSGGNSGGSSLRRPVRNALQRTTVHPHPPAKAARSLPVDGTVTITPDEGYQIGSVTVNGEELKSQQTAF